MKLIIVTPYWLPLIGGITTNVLNLVETLRKRKISVTVITRIGERDNDVYAIRTIKIVFIIKTFFILCKKKPDVMHSQSNWYTLMPCALYKLLYPQKKLIHTVRTDFSNNEKLKLNWIKKYMYKWLLNRCDVVTFVSNNLRKKYEASNFNIKTKTKVVYGGVMGKKVDKKGIEEFKKKYFLKDDNRPVITFIGILGWKMKVEGVKRLIKSFKIVVKRYPNAKLLIVGDGPHKEELEILVKSLSINRNVTITGFLDNVSIPLKVTDIYAHISLQESFGMSILEAMSMKKPVIAPPTGGIPEIVVHNKTGILVDPQPQSIANAIIELYEDKEKMNRLSENAWRTVEKEFTWDKTCDEFMKLYI